MVDYTAGGGLILLSGVSVSAIRCAADIVAIASHSSWEVL